MKRITLLAVLFACGLLATAAPAAAQTTTNSWFMGHINLLLLNRDDIASSKFEEYRTVPKGISLPALTLRGDQKNVNFAFYGQQIGLADQRYTGWAKTSWMGFSFDYNQVVHNMGNDAHSMWAETAPGVWSMSPNLRAANDSAIQAVASSARTYPFYLNLFGGTMAAANLVNLTSQRDRGTYEFDLSGKLPFDLVATYMHEAKTGYRGAGGGRLDGVLTNILEVPWRIDEVTQDLGVRAALNKSWGNVHGAYSHNWYNNLQETTTVDNPIRATDAAYTSSAATPYGGAAQAFFVGAPDNSADQGSFGVFLKFARQTRVTADAVFSQWIQNAQLYPYTLNSTILNGSGVPANTLAALDAQSANGKINTTVWNVGFSSRPFDNVGLRARYRTWDMNNRTATFLRTGSAGNSPDRSWSALTAASYTTEAPFGYVAANPYGEATKRFDLQASYDYKTVTAELSYFNTQIDRVYREAETGTESGWTLAAVLHQNNWLRVRANYGQDKRTASMDGVDTATFIGFQADESDRESKRAGMDVELSPADGKYTLVFAYLYHNDDYPNQLPRAVDASGNRIAGTENGLLKAKYSTYTVEADWTPNDRANAGFYYTYEDNLSRTRYGGTGSSANAPYTPLMSMLTFDGADKTNTFGVNARWAMKPDTWTLFVDARRQKVDGLMAIIGDPAGSFALARAAYGGIANIDDYNDTDIRTVKANLDYAVAKGLIVTLGYWYQKYTFADAYSTPTSEMMPASGGFYLKANDGSYTANVVYLKMNYRW